MAYGNALLDRIASSIDTAALFDQMRLRQFELHDRMDDDGAIVDVVFPVTAVISLLTTSEEQGAIELATIGNEGFIGVPVFLGATTFLPGEFAQCQVAGAAWSLRRETFESYLRNEKAVWQLTARYVQAYQSLLARQVLCNLLHSVDQRVCRWLLVTGDRASAAEFALTQDFLSEMLGVRRASVSQAQRTLQELNLIEYGRGRMRLLDRAGLEERCCPCYAVMKDRYDAIFA